MLKNGLFFATVCLMLFACNERKATQNQTNKGDTAGAIHTDTIPKKNVVTAIITNSEGVSLKLKFNNADGTCEVEFNGEVIELKQQRMASGIKYSNDHFVYSEWHGEIRLYKDGKLVFSHND